MFPINKIVQYATFRVWFLSRSFQVSSMLQLASDLHSCLQQNTVPLAHMVGEGNGTPLQYSCLENPMGGGAWWAAVHGVAKSRT